MRKNKTIQKERSVTTRTKEKREKNYSQQSLCKSENPSVLLLFSWFFPAKKISERTF